MDSGSFPRIRIQRVLRRVCFNGEGWLIIVMMLMFSQQRGGIPSIIQSVHPITKI